MAGVPEGSYPGGVVLSGEVGFAANTQGTKTEGPSIRISGWRGPDR